ncbi:MAG: arylesterase [Methylovirgula sp.]
MRSRENDAPSRRKGPRRRLVHTLLAWVIPAVFGFVSLPGTSAAHTLKLIAFGDSLSAGYLLPANEAFPAVLQKALHKDGLNVNVVNAGVSGDTASGGLARLDWTLADGADAVILELGANDMLRGTDPTVTRKALDTILARLTARHIKVLIAGMLATPSLGKTYTSAFDKIFPELAAKYKAPLYPFFLNGVTTHKNLTLSDGMHPNGAGVDKIVAGILPQVEALLRSIPTKTIRQNKNSASDGNPT